jgi:hypothetical protein
MKGNHRLNRTLRGQTLIIALIILFVLLLIGFVFLGILDRNIKQANTAQQRTLSADLADAGVRYAQEQLLNNPLGADWRPAQTLPLVIEDGSNPPNFYSTPPGPPNNKALYAVDPDEYWIRPASIALNTSPVAKSGYYLIGNNQFDMGGPDGLGPFSRIQFKNGRALIRVRYAPTDIDINAGDINEAGGTDPDAYYGPLRQPGLAHNYTIIESVGRPGLLNPSDPTSVPTLTNVPDSSPYVNPVNNGVMYQQFPSQAALQGAVAVWAQVDNQFVQSRKLMALASIGIIDHALYVTNKEGSQNPIPIGFPTDLGVAPIGPNPGAAVPPKPSVIIGTEIPNTALPTPPTNPSPFPNYSGGGSIYVNGNATFYGNIIANLNEVLGDAILVAGNITGAVDLTGANPASIQLNVFQGGPGGTNGPVNVFKLDDVTGVGIQGPVSSSAPGFNTLNSLYRDGNPSPDASLQPRSVTTKQAPSILHTDIDTGLNRYITLTRDSGVIGAAGNSGLYGHGSGVYVNNPADLQVQNDPNGHISAGGADSLTYDFLNPNNNQPGSSWQGQYYVPPGAYLQLDPDGFRIKLDGGQTWLNSLGSNADGLGSEIHYRLGFVGNTTYIVDSLTPGVDIGAPYSSINFSLGRPFNGVLFFEGNVRVRGEIPTTAPLTVVSMGNIYIEGSITKGITDPATFATIQQLPTTGIALLARDYVVLNTTQFFGPGPNPVTEKNSIQNPTGMNPVVLPAAPGNTINLLTEFLVDPDNSLSGQPNNMSPAFWSWFAGEYQTTGNTAETSRFLISQTMDDGPNANAYVQMDVDSGVLANSGYLFPQPDGSFGDIYQLGQEPYQRYTKFETNDFPFLTPNNISTLGVANYATGTNAAPGTFQAAIESSTPIQIYSPPVTPNGGANDALIGRLAIAPHDIRIEATMFAEEGSFFIIPGDWFNPNPSDTRAEYVANGSNPVERLEDKGNGPFVPFYQEPLDIKITIDGAISENLPPPVSQQIEMYKKWAWIPWMHGSSGELIPGVHDDPEDGQSVYTSPNYYVPNLYIRYDPNLGTGRLGGYTPSGISNTNPPLRPNPQDPTGLSMLPPLPCLPVSPTLFYFGEVNP